MRQVEEVLRLYDIDALLQVEALGQGLIHKTWKITTPAGDFVLQKINHHVFRQPQWIEENLSAIEAHLKQHHPQYFFVAPLPAKDGRKMVKLDQEYFRLFPFVKASRCYDAVTGPQQAFQAALQFARFTKLLSGFDALQLHITLPHFHDLHYRYQQFLTAIGKADEERKNKAAKCIKELKLANDIVIRYTQLVQTGSLKTRVMHHDTKISNVLFDASWQALCIIDFDTVMPGFFISDLGDMMRTYLSPATEEETDFSKLTVRPEIFKAVVEGYLSEMGSLLTTDEKQCIFYAGEFMIYMQALRFLTDYLNNDVYYGRRYQDHNLNRAANQLVLLQQYRQLKTKH